MKLKVSIIILNYNGLDFLKKCIQTVKKQTYSNIEIIVTDNASTDGSIEWVKKESGKLRMENKKMALKIVKHKNNLGYAGANNSAAKKASGEFLFFLNNDTELFPDCIEKIVSSFKEKSIVTARQIPTLDKKFIGSSGAGADIFGYPYVDPDPTKTRVFYADGAMFFTKKKDFIDLGMFDEKLFIFQEDIDLSWRARLYGYSIISCWEAKLYHYGGGTVLGGTKKGSRYASSYLRRYLNEKNIIRNILKNYSALMCIIILPLLLIIHVVEMISLLFLLQGRVINCYIKAYWWNIKNIRNTLQLRSHIQDKRTVSDSKIIKQMYWRYSKLASLKSVGVPDFK